MSAAGSLLRPPMYSHKHLTSRRSAFAGGSLPLQLQRLSLRSQPAARAGPVTVEALGRRCALTGKKANNGYTVTFSHKRNKRRQHVNLQDRKVYWPERERWVKIKLCTKALKTVEKNGLATTAAKMGVDLASLPFQDARPGRREWLANREEVRPTLPRSLTKRRMKNPEKLAASKKKPLVAKYIEGNRIMLVRAE